MAPADVSMDGRLSASQRRLVTILTCINDPVIATDEQGLIFYMNPAAEALLCYPQLEPVGSALDDLLILTEAGTGASIDDPAAHARASGRAVVQQHAHLRVIGNSDEMPVTYNAAPVYDDAGNAAGAVLVFSNQTGRRASAERLAGAQAALARTAKLTALGELTASIVHEVNQPVAAIVTNAQACLRWLTGPTVDVEQACRATRRIVENGQKAATVVRSIQGLARNTPPNLTPLELNEIVDEVLSFVRLELSRTHVILTSLVSKNLPVVMADPVQLWQVLLNLTLNGIEEPVADQQDRRIEIDATLATPEIVTVTVADNGPGVDPSIADRLFDPLFTTKIDGMGLGLSICRSIVQAHGGQIGYSARQPHGSVFHFTLRVDSAVARKPSL